MMNNGKVKKKKKREEFLVYSVLLYIYSQYAKIIENVVCPRLFLKITNPWTCGI